MQIKVDLPAGLECRGRNGWFGADHGCVTPIQGGTVHVEIFSSRPSRDCAPITITGPVADVKTLLGELLDAVTKATS